MKPMGPSRFIFLGLILLVQPQHIMQRGNNRQAIFCTSRFTPIGIAAQAVAKSARLISVWFLTHNT